MPVFLLYLIIYGFRGVTTTAARGQFHCPRCGPASYRHQIVRRFFTLYFIPLIPLRKAGEYVECGTCKSTFQPAVLQRATNGAAAPFEPEHVAALRRTLVLVCIADKVVDPRELAAIQQVFSELTQQPITAQQIHAEIEAASRDAQPLPTFLATMAARLNTHGKELVIRGAYRVAAADGVFPAQEWQRLTEIAHALGIEPAHFRRVIA